MITIDRAIYIMKMARATHQMVVDFPENSPIEVGTVSFHKEWISKYDQVIEFLEALKADKIYRKKPQD